MINADEFEHNDIVYKNTERNFEEKGAMVSFVVRFGLKYKMTHLAADEVLSAFI